MQDDRFGIAFDNEIDSQLARKPEERDPNAPTAMIERSWAHRAPPMPDSKGLRKI
ncbi:MAG: hypothetical protein SXU28_03975 [Pseudomonadota bacterium]|nr:hypothetical protein [Pseudomonadota bacterium]